MHDYSRIIMIVWRCKVALLELESEYSYNYRHNKKYYILILLLYTVF